MRRASKAAVLSRRGGIFPPPETGKLGMGDDRFGPNADILNCKALERIRTNEP